jgi:hypothetical protein
MTPQLSVVICALGRPGADAAVTSVFESAAACGVEAQVVLVWQSQSPAPELPLGAAVLRVLPAGVSYARNRGIAVAAAEVVAFIDDDERAAPGWARAVVAAFGEGADAAVGPIVPADERGIPHCHFEGTELRWYRDLDIPPWQIGSGGNLAVRRTLLCELGGFDQRMGPGSFGRAAEDTELLARLLQRGAHVRWRPDMIVSHPTKTPAERLATRFPYGFGAGRMVRRLRSPLLASRYGVGLLWGVRGAIRERSQRRAREVAATAAGFVRGVSTRDAWRSPQALLERIPQSIRDALGARRLRAWPVPHRSTPHFLWGAGDDLVLHAYAGMPAGWSAGVDARGAALAAGVSGVPAVVAAGASDDLCWVLERRMPGNHPTLRTQWWAGAADWAVALARTSGPALCSTPWWEQVRERVPARRDMSAALERLAGKPAVIVHGDLQRKNVLMSRDGSIAMVDWEQAVVHGPPGLDLLYLAVTSHKQSARAAAVRDLAAGRDASATPVLARLAAIGLDAADIRAALIVALHMWAADERIRRQRLGTAPQPAIFEPLLGVVEGAAPSAPF